MTLFETPNSPSHPLVIFLVQAFIIVVVTRLCARILRLIRQPAVIGEIIGGILLGPSALGHADGWMKAIFPSYSLGQLQLVANIGLILFMFLLGLVRTRALVLACASAPLCMYILCLVVRARGRGGAWTRAGVRECRRCAAGVSQLFLCVCARARISVGIFMYLCVCMHVCVRA